MKDISSQGSAKKVALLFILATVAYVIGSDVLLNPLLNDTNYLTVFSQHHNKVIVGVLLEILAGFSSAAIAIWLYPILTEYDPPFALGAVCFRVMEGLLYIVSGTVLLLLLTFSQEYVRSGAETISVFQSLGTVLKAFYSWTTEIAVLAFNLGALSYYYVFYRSQLIPRWLSLWGIAGALLLLSAILLSLFGVFAFLSPIFVILTLPIALQEMVFAYHLLTKGFRIESTERV